MAAPPISGRPVVGPGEPSFRRALSTEELAPLTGWAAFSEGQHDTTEGYFACPAGCGTKKCYYYEHASWKDAEG